MFVTTHSPIFVDRIDFDNSSIWFVTKEKKITKVERGKYHIKMWSYIAKNTQLPVFYLFDGDATQQIEESRTEGFLTEDHHYLLSVSDIEDLYPMAPRSSSPPLEQARSTCHNN